MKKTWIFGILAVVTYLATIIVGSFMRPEYKIFIDPVSRIFAKGLPYSNVIVSLFVLSNILIVLFALGIIRSTKNSMIRAGMVSLILASAIGSILFVFFPMDPWEGVRTASDVVHNNIVSLMAILMSLSMILVYFGSRAENSWQKLSKYFLVSAILFLIAGVASGISLQYYWGLIGTFESLWIIIFLQWLTAISLHNYRTNAVNNRGKIKK